MFWELSLLKYSAPAITKLCVGQGSVFLYYCHGNEASQCVAVYKLKMSVDYSMSESQAIVDECSAFFGQFSESVMKSTTSNIELQIKSTDLKKHMNLASCYIFFARHERRAVYKDSVDRQTGPREIIGYEDVHYKDSFTISVYDDAKPNQATMFKATENAVFEEIGDSNTISVILDRYIDSHALSIRLLPTITHIRTLTKQRVLENFKKSIQKNLSHEVIDPFLENVLQNTNSSLVISEAVSLHELTQLILDYTNNAIKDRIGYVLSQVRRAGSLKSQFETSVKQRKLSGLEQADDVLLRVLNL